MKPKTIVRILGVSVTVIAFVGLLLLFSQPQPEPEQVDQVDTTTNPSWEEHKAIEAAEKPPEVTVQKSWTNGEITIDYEVGVENGVEESPPPDVLRAINEATTQEQKDKWLEDYFNSDFYKQRHQYDEARKQHNYKYIKSYIDESFTCENYNDLAYKYQMDMLFDDQGNYVDAENYIYERAFNECIDPKHQEDLEEIEEKLKEVNEPN